MNTHLTLAAVALLALGASAYPQDLQGMPNGASYGITLGHPGGNKKQTTGIARAYYGAGQRWTKAFCQADTDGDGQSNGLEMGDPCCLWTKGAAPMFTTGLSNPNSAADKTANSMPNCAAMAQAFATTTLSFVAEQSAPAAAYTATASLGFDVQCDACLEFTGDLLPAWLSKAVCHSIMHCKEAPPAPPAPTTPPSGGHGTYGECNCQGKDGQLHKFQVSSCAADACWTECIKNGLGTSEYCVTKMNPLMVLKREIARPQQQLGDAPMSCATCNSELSGNIPETIAAKICAGLVKCQAP